MMRIHTFHTRLFYLLVTLSCLLSLAWPAPAAAGGGLFPVARPAAGGRTGIDADLPVWLFAGDGMAEDEFGLSVAVSGDMAIVGAPFARIEGGPPQGAAFLFERNHGELGAWQQVSKIYAADGAEGDSFGQSVAISGGLAVVGAPNADIDGTTHQGAVYVFRQGWGGAGKWGQAAKLTVEQGAIDDQFGWSVAIDGDTIVAGAPNEGVYQGAAYVFERDAGGALAWNQAARLAADDGMPGDYLGHAVAIDGETVVAGAPLAGIGGNIGQGAAYIFERDGEWSQAAKLFDGAGLAGDGLGSAVDIDADEVVVGAYSADVGGGADQGAVYIFGRDQGGAGQWGQVALLAAADGATGDRFGSSVTADIDAIAVGVPGATVDGNVGQGAAYLFERDRGGAGLWGQVVKLDTLGDMDDYFGTSVALSGDALVVGVPQSEAGGYTNRGAAYVYSVPSWLIAADGQASDQFGYAVAISGDTAIVGAYLADTGGQSAQGVAYVLERDAGGPGAWGQAAKLVAGDGAKGDGFGWSVAISGTTAIVGAIGADIDDQIDQGAAYIFERDAGGPGAWGQAAKLIADDGEAYDQFGWSVAVCGDTAAVGSPLSTGDRGAVYVFERDQGGPGLWGQAAKVVAADGEAGDYLGYALALDGDTLVAGAPYADLGDDPKHGATYVFERDQGGPGAWGQVTQLVVPPQRLAGRPLSEFGYAVDIDGDTALVGTLMSAVVWVFERDEGVAAPAPLGAEQGWELTGVLVADDGTASDWFGSALTISGDTAIVGAPQADDGSSQDEGAIYVFRRDEGGPGAWGQHRKITALDGVEGDLFASSVALDGSLFVAGAPHVATGGNLSQGAAYAFDLHLPAEAGMSVVYLPVVVKQRQGE